MLKRVKNWLGIEGVKVELLVPETIPSDSGVIKGKVRFTSMNEQTVTAISLRLIEKYSRGRKKKKLTDEYLLSAHEVNKIVEVPKDGSIEVDFEMSFDLLKSKMDQIQERNFILKGLVSAAKKLKSVKSEYRLEVEADVVGTALNPFDRKVIQLD